MILIVVIVIIVVVRKRNSAKTRPTTYVGRTSSVSSKGDLNNTRTSLEFVNPLYAVNPRADVDVNKSNPVFDGGDLDTYGENQEQNYGDSGM